MREFKVLHVFKSQIPEGQSGNWKVERFSVSKQESQLDAMRGAFHGGRYVPAGTYTALKRGNEVIMSDTPDELRDLWELKRQAKSGHVLIMGLGLGCAVQFVLEHPEVSLVTVIEQSPDVINLVEPTLKAFYKDRLEVIQGDALEWKPPKGVRYTAVWHDIWDAICGDNLEQMTKLKRRYGRRTDWQGCWCEFQCRRAERQWKKEEAMYAMFRR